MKREIINISEEKCTGCALCIPNCPEGAIQVIDGKARLVSDLMCDGLGACLGHCPEGAITIETREAEPYDERKVMANIVTQGPNTVKAHLAHLKDHGQTEYYNQAVAYLGEKNMPVPGVSRRSVSEGSCPGSQSQSFGAEGAAPAAVSGTRPSELTQWPIQLHLIAPNAPHFQGADVVLAADCVAYALGDFHKDYLKGKKLIIACPKLDQGQEIYLQKLTTLIDMARINTLTVIIMQVPCCRGLLQLAKQALAQAQRKIPIKLIVVGIQGQILQEDWV